MAHSQPSPRRPVHILSEPREFERPTTWRTVILPGFALVVLASALTGIFNGGFDPYEGAPDRELEEAPAGYSAPEAGDSAQPDAEPVEAPEFDGDPKWSVSTPGDDRTGSIRVLDDGYVYADREGLLARLDSDGETMWDAELDDGYGSSFAIAGSTVLISKNHPDDDRWPQPKIVTAYDIDSGDELWEEAEASFWTVADDTLYMSVCYGGQNDSIGDCTMSAREPRTNSVTWSTPTYASSQLAGTGTHSASQTPYLIVKSFPSGHASQRLHTMHADTGADLGFSMSTHKQTEALGDLLVHFDDSDDNPADGCTADIGGFDPVTGETEWETTVYLPKHDDGSECSYIQDKTVGDGLFGWTDGEGMPHALDLSDGEIVWSGDDAAEVVKSVDGSVLARLDEADADADLVLYDVESGATVWQTSSHGMGSGAEVAVGDDTLVAVSDYSEGPGIGVDLSDGQTWKYPSDDHDPYARLVGGELIVCEAATCHGYAVD